MAELFGDQVIGNLTNKKSDEGIGSTSYHQEIMISWYSQIPAGDQLQQDVDHFEEMFDAIVAQRACQERIPVAWYGAGRRYHHAGICGAGHPLGPACAAFATRNARKNSPHALGGSGNISH